MNTATVSGVSARAEKESNVSPRKARLFYAALIGVLFCLLVWPVILSRSPRQDNTGAEGDAQLFHYPTILKMEKAWPHPDLSDVGGAQMTPTFHVIMAGFMHYFHLGPTGLRMINSFSGLGLILTVFWYASRCTDARTAFALSLPYLLSPFMLCCAMWLVTADMAFFFAAVG